MNIPLEILKIILYYTICIDENKIKNYKNISLTCKKFQKIAYEIFPFDNFLQKITDFLCIKKLIQENKIKDINNLNFLLRLASQNGYLELIKSLLKFKVDINQSLMFGVLFGQFESVKLLLNDKRINFYQEYPNAIQTAVENKQTEIVELLLKDGRLDPSLNNDYCIRIASQKEYVEIVRLLLNDKRVNPLALNNSAIRLAKLGGNKELINLLLKDNRVTNVYTDNNFCLIV